MAYFVFVKQLIVYYKYFYKVFFISFDFPNTLQNKLEAFSALLEKKGNGECGHWTNRTDQWKPMELEDKLLSLMP